MDEDAPSAGSASPFARGRCACGAIHFTLHDAPYVVHCCHCTDCQRETGSAFALNAVIESDRLTLSGPAPERLVLPSASGRGQQLALCPDCKTTLWSHYSGSGVAAAFVRVGTLDDPGLCPPSVHIFTRSKRDFVGLPEGAESFEAFYSGRDIVRIYGEEGAARLRALRGR